MSRKKKYIVNELRAQQKIGILSVAKYQVFT